MEIGINKIRPSAFQLRTSLGGLEELAFSIKQYGLLQPIVVRPMQREYEVVAGNRRLAAAKLLKLRKISTHTLDLSDKEAFEMGLVENVQHKTMNPIEEALAFNQYSRDLGWGGITDLSKRIGKSQEFVTKRIQLLRLPENIRNEIIRQRISPSVALELLPLNSDSMQGFVDFVIKNPLTKLEVRKIVRSSVSDKKEDFIDQLQTRFNHEQELYLIDKTLRKSIALMKSTLLNFDEIVSSVNDDWILKELLMQYRMIIHGDIDTFLKLRKRLRLKIPRDYLNISKDSSHVTEEFHSIGSQNGDKIYHWATRGIWQ